MRKKSFLSFWILGFVVVVVAAAIFIYLQNFSTPQTPFSQPDWWKVYPTISIEKCSDWNGKLIEAKENLECEGGMIPGAKVGEEGSYQVCCMFVNGESNNAFQSPFTEAQLAVRSLLNEELGGEIEIEVVGQTKSHLYGDYQSADGEIFGKFYSVKMEMQWEISAFGKNTISCDLGKQHGYPEEWLGDCIE